MLFLRYFATTFLYVGGFALGFGLMAMFGRVWSDGVDDADLGMVITGGIGVILGVSVLVATLLCLFTVV